MSAGIGSGSSGAGSNPRRCSALDISNASIGLPAVAWCSRANVGRETVNDVFRLMICWSAVALIVALQAHQKSRSTREEVDRLRSALDALGRSGVR